MNTNKRLAKLENKLDWRLEAIELIKRGAIDYYVLRELAIEYGKPPELADELFNRADVDIPPDTRTPDDKITALSSTLKTAILDAVHAMNERGDNPLDTMRKLTHGKRQVTAKDLTDDELARIIRGE